MLTLALKITYNKVTKTVHCKGSLTINQLVELSLKSFNVNKSFTGDLVHNGKTVDKSLPLRWSNFTNNTRFELRVYELKDDLEVSVKLVVSDNKETTSYISKVSNSLSIKNVIHKFEEVHGIQLIQGDRPFEILLMRNRIMYDDKQIERRLVDILGNQGNSVQMRLTYISRSFNNTQEQQEINEIQKKSIREYQLKKKEEIENLQQEEEEKEIRKQEDSKLKAAENEKEKKEEELRKEEISQGNDETSGTRRGLLAEDEVESKTSRVETTRGESLTAKEQEKEKQPARKDTLYKPSAYLRYENPDSDYDMTVDQARKYHKLIRDSSRPSRPKPKQVPKRYSIRVKFPDRNILQLELENSQVTMNHFISKLNSHLIDNTIPYTLRIGYPPFSKISLLLEEDEKAMLSWPEFQNEKLLLIWEPQISVKPPYISTESLEDANIKKFEDIPEVKLDSSQPLIDSNEGPSESSRQTDRPISQPFRSGLHSESTSKIPKWLKLTRR